jgi:cytochrome c oxidase subunit 2
MSWSLRSSGSALGRTAALIGLGVLAACGGEPEPATREEAPAQEASEEISPGVRRLGPDQYEVLIHTFVSGYRPSEVRVPAGAEITFRLTSEDVPHGFTIEGTDVQIEVQPNVFTEVKHTFTEPGDYTFLCHVYCGGGHEGMQARIIVEAAPATAPPDR